MFLLNMNKKGQPLKSPIQQKVHKTKTLFDLAFQKVAWEIHLSIIPFLTTYLLFHRIMRLLNLD